VSGERVIRVSLLDDHEVVLASPTRSIGRSPACLRSGLMSPSKTFACRRCGVTVCREIRSNFDPSPASCGCRFSGDEALIQAIVAGASGYLLKQI
jgi:hypothetical protein